MLDVRTGKETEAMYQMLSVSGKDKEIKYMTNNINYALNYLKWYVKKYNRGLFLKILKLHKIYDNKNKIVRYCYE